MNKLSRHQMRENAFMLVFEKNFSDDSVEEIHFAEGTPSIAAAAVEGCPNLKRVYVPASAEVADGAFPAGVEIVRF